MHLLPRARGGRPRRGAAVVEYAILLMLIGILAMGAVFGVGDRISEAFSESGDRLAEARPGAPASLALGGTALGDAIVAQSYSHDFTAQLSPAEGMEVSDVAWTATGVPPGLAIDPATGVLSGSAATATAPMPVSISVTAAGGGRTASRDYTLTVLPALTLADGALADAAIGEAYTAELADATSTPASATSWAVAAGSLPAGMTLDTDAGTISGTSPAAESAEFDISASAYGQTAQASFTIEVAGSVGPAMRRIASGYQYSCAVTDDPTASGGTKCWGGGHNKKLGQATAYDVSVPIDVDYTDQKLVSIASGYENSCAITENADVVCWGDNDFGQIGNGTQSIFNASAPVLTDPIPAPVVEIGVGLSKVCALTDGGDVYCWGGGRLGNGGNNEAHSPQKITTLGGAVTSISVGYGGTTCAIMAAGGVQCWGRNRWGELGTGDTTARNTPTPVQGLGGTVVDMGLAYRHSCAVLASGAAKCWGLGANGKLGTGKSYADGEKELLPTQVDGLTSGVAEIAAANGFTCARMESGSVQCWGNFEPPAPRLSPQPISGISNALQIDVGGSHTCAYVGMDDYKCWGWNENGQLGLGYGGPDFSTTAQGIKRIWLGE